ncbi:efflux RND transporter permease subunit [candidate division WOR-3 bacterium]|nr:efflux RND transporter permease subunit [candidate division WOR-3 bacterium]
MKISQLAISSSLTVFIVAIAAALFGVYAYFSIPVELVPDVNIPWISVTIPYPGAAPEEVEKQISKIVEEDSRGIEDLKHVYSYSSNSGAQIWYEFDIGVDNDDAKRDIEEIINRVKHEFPEDAMDPIIRDIKLSEMPVIFLTLKSENGDKTSYENLKRYADDIAPIFEGISGVSRVDVFGGRERQFMVLLREDKLREYGLTIPLIIGRINSSNIDLPAGSINLGEKDYTLRVLGAYRSKEDIENTVITVTANGPVYLSDISTVLDTLEKATSYSRFNSHPSVTLAIYKKTNGNTIGISKRIREELEIIRENLPLGISFDITFDQSDYINENLNQLKQNAIFGSILVILILVLGVGWRNAVLVMISIPLIISTSFAALFLLGYSLNNMSLFSMILLVGMIVDGAIIVIESTYRYLEYGYDKMTAARKGIDETGGAILASALTTMAAFFPMFMIRGVTGEFMKLIPITVIIALSSSILVDHLVIPAVASKFLIYHSKAAKRRDRWVNSRVMRTYRKILDWALDHRVKTLIFAGTAFILSLALLPVVGFELWPSSGFDQFTVNVSVPTGTPTEDIDEISKKIEALIAQIPEVEKYTSNVSGNTAQIEVRLFENSGKKDIEVREILLAKIDSIKHEIAEARVEMRGESMGPPSGAPITVEIKGDNIDVLMDIAYKIKQFLRQQEGTRNVKDDFGSGSPEVEVIIKRREAAYYGVTPADIVQPVSVSFNGTDATEMNIGDDKVKVRVELEESDKTLDVLRSFPVPTASGSTVPLEQVADINVTSGFSQINRVDGMRQVTVSSDVYGVLAFDVIKKLEPFIDSLQTPGYTINITGDKQQMEEDFGGLGIALLIGVALIYLIMVIQFQSLSHPFVIMFTVPFSIIGVLLSLLITRNHFGVMPFIGTIALVGIVVNDAIVFVTYTNKLRKDGMPIYQALRKAGPVRLRPILMTSVTTMGGMLPLALGIGMKYKFWGPMVWPIIFGLLFATLLTLLVIPVVYSFINKAGKMPHDLEPVDITESD